ncbi:MAG: amino acid adenylation protein, partial [Bacteroidetes bacterium]|nr:amino acid adenylation protein [Bacteroidota bacterium]
DKKQLPDPEDHGMSTGTQYIPPANEIEIKLVEIFEEVLKKSPVGLQDDFFILGGDSIKAIQIVSRLKQKGYEINTQDVLQYPVLKNLSGKIKVLNSVVSQETVEGIIPLSPIQSYFFSNNSNHHHFNQSVLLTSHNRISEEALKLTLDKIVQHHDALRMVFYQEHNEWVQKNLGTTQSYSLEIIEDQNEESIKLYCDRVQGNINLKTGPLLKAVVFRQQKKEDRLLLVIHHLVVDGVSWRILFEDLATLYSQFASGKTAVMPTKTHSFKEWQNQQLLYSRSGELMREYEYWNSKHISPDQLLPEDFPGGSNYVSDTEVVFFSMNEQESSLLMRQCYKSLHTEINDILIAALTYAVKDTFEKDKVAIKLEGHGRENIGGNLDVSRTVGWFTTFYPVIIDMHFSNNLLRHITEVKENLHRIPNKGIGYGILKYILGKQLPESHEITFNYLGDFGSGVDSKEGEQLFGFSDDYRGKEISASGKRDTKLDVSAMVTGNCLSVSIGFSNKQYNRQTIEKLSASYKQRLGSLIAFLSSLNTRRLTPVDLTYKELSVDQLDELTNKYTVEDVYTLSPLQQGIYFHWLSSPGSLAFFEQMSYRLKGALNINILEESYNTLISRHAILRTFFSQTLGKEALQVVQKEVQPHFKYIKAAEISGFSIAEYKNADKLKGFNLHESSQMRLTVVQDTDGTHELIWSHYHILMDGWCMGLLIREFFLIYDSLLKGEDIQLPSITPYSDYIKWLGTVDKNKSLLYWKEYLSGYYKPSSLPVLREKKNDSFEHGETVFSLSKSASDLLRALCKESGITENVFIQTIWGILLGKYNHTNDAVFGSVVSGRPAQINGIEEMIGLFINTVPVRVQAEEKMPVKELLRNVQDQYISGINHHYVQLAEIQSQSVLSRRLFNHILIFFNYPVYQSEASVQNEPDDLSVVSSDVFEQVNYDFMFVTMPGENISFRFNYNQNVYQDWLIEKIKDDLLGLIEQVISVPEKSIKQLNVRIEKQEPVPVYFDKTAVDTGECSEHQKRLWFIHRFEKNYLYSEGPVYHNIPVITEIEETLRLSDLDNAVKKIVERHLVLRTRIFNKDELPVQVPLADIENISVRVSNENAETHFSELCFNIINKSFDLENDHLIRFDLVQCISGKKIFVITAHHIIADRASLALVNKEILSLAYQKVKSLDVVAENQYASFSIWQNNLSDAEIGSSLLYWRNKLTGAPVIQIDTDHLREHVHVYSAGMLNKHINSELSGKINAFCSENKVTPVVFFLAAYNILLHKYSGSSDLVIGTISGNRTEKNLDAVIGPLANLVPLRNEIHGDLVFSEVLSQVHNEYLASMAHAIVPFERIVTEVNPAKDMSRTALFDIIMHYEVDVEKTGSHQYELNYGLGKYDLNLLIKNNDGFSTFLTYNKNYFEESRMKRLLEHLTVIIEQVTTTPWQKISEIEYLRDIDRMDLLGLGEDGEVG